MQTENMRNPFDVLVQQIKDGLSYMNRPPVRKIYIEEDPANEQVVPCPRCLDRDQQNMVRYLFLNLSEAIYKCEAYDCMYPFRDFKYKNVDECSVYRYEELQSVSQQHDFDTNYVEDFSTSYDTCENSIDHLASVDNRVDFLSCDAAGDNITTQPCTAPQLNFAQSARTIDPADDFNAGLIELLEDLFPGASNPVPSVAEPVETKEVSTKPISTVTVNQNLPCKSVTQSSSGSRSSSGSNSSGRKLEKCLKKFEKPGDARVCKKPKSPAKDSLVVEHISPTRVRIKRVPQAANSQTRTNAGKQRERNLVKPFPLDVSSNGTLKQAKLLVKSKKLKPLELVSKLNTMTETAAPTVRHQQPTTVPSNDKVQKMVSFIQRSAKTSDETKSSPPVTVPKAEGNDGLSGASQVTIEPPPHLSTMKHAEVYFPVNSPGRQVNKLRPIVSMGNSSSDPLPTSSTSGGGMEMLFDFMES